MLLYEQKTLNCDLDDKNTLYRTESIMENIKNKLYRDTNYEAINIAYREDDLDEIIEFSEYIKNNFQHLVVVGIGGSSLGAKTFIALKPDSNVTFLENIDSDSCEFLFNKIDYKNTAFLVISKSGETIECISNTLLLIKIVQENLGKSAIREHFFFLTEEKENNPLLELAKNFEIKTINHNKNIGGRFSYLSNVGLIPACVAGFDIKKIRSAAAEILDYFSHEKENFILNICAKQCELYNNGIKASVLMPYKEKLKNLSEWYRQLWAESLGKNGFGVIPINALGTTDQHSQLQLYMDGARIFFYTFITSKNRNSNLKITSDFSGKLYHLNNKTLDKIMAIEAKSTIEVLNRRNLPIRIFEMQEINEASLSQLMTQYILETIVVAEMQDINPFGQPAVEERKKLAREMMLL